MQHPLDPKSTPVVHVPRRVPVAVREKHKAELDRMEVTDIISKVTEYTDWVISLVVVEKPKADKMCICLDPRDIDKVTLRPHYPVRTLEYVLPNWTGAQFFTKLDERSGYWNKPSLLTTFNTPFGRYRFLRLPFGVKTTQGEFQLKVDESYEGLVAIVDTVTVMTTVSRCAR